MNRIMPIAGVLMATMGVALEPNTANACGLMEWLFGRQPTPQVAGTNCDPCNTYSPPVVQQSVPQTAVRYVPQTCYRTQYTRVPVTVYRPVANVDPCSGCQTTCMRPCTTYTYQARRVPYTTYRPVYTTTYSVSYAPQSGCASGTCNTGACVGGNCNAGYAPATGCTNCAASPLASSYTTYQTPATAPATPVQAADMAPSLNGTTSVRRVPPGEIEAPTPPPADVPMNNGMGNGTMGNGNMGNGAGTSENGTSNGKVADPGYLNPASTNPHPQMQFKPVPDPARGGNGTVGPQLLSPQQKTAARPVKKAWGFTPIAWPEERPVRPTAALAESYPSTTTATNDSNYHWAKQPSKSHRVQLDDSGWEPIR